MCGPCHLTSIPYCPAHPISFRLTTLTYLHFYLTHRRIISFGILLTLFSSFGQTFLISLFVPHLLTAFTLDTAQFGAIYGGVTLLSALCIPAVGRLLDRVSLRPFSLAVGTLLVLACLLAAAAPNIAVLAIALFGLRLTGQGLLTLTSSTTMARVFVQGRGRALSLAALGYPLGEALLPLGTVLLISGFGWRLSWGLIGLAIALVLLPATYLLLRTVPEHGAAASHAELSARPFSLLGDGRFHLLVAANLFLPMVLTALFLYQVPLAEAKGWTVQTMATAFVGFAVARLGGSLLIGPCIDRWGALRLFPFMLAPVCVGLLLLGVGSAPGTAFFYLAMAGLSQGVAFPMMTALLAEVYGVASLGATKGLVSTFSIFATAVGPVLLGWLLKAGVPFSTIVPACAALALLLIGTSLLVRRQLRHSPGRPA
jgi:MFS family permease